MSAVEYRDLDSLIRSLHELEPSTERAVKDELRLVGGMVSDDATERFRKYDDATAAGFRVRVRVGGLVQVEQSKRKTTGTRPDFGALQMTKALLPAREAKLEQAAVGLEKRVLRVMHQHGF